MFHCFIKRRKKLFICLNINNNTRTQEKSGPLYNINSTNTKPWKCLKNWLNIPISCGYGGLVEDAMKKIHYYLFFMMRGTCTCIIELIIYLYILNPLVLQILCTIKIDYGDISINDNKWSQLNSYVYKMAFYTELTILHDTEDYDIYGYTALQNLRLHEFTKSVDTRLNKSFNKIFFQG